MHNRAISSDHKNNFGFLRLLFAALVIVSHSPELIDGNRSREILTRVFGTMSFGEVAVDGFFLVSGYLITKSFVENPSISTYLIRRVLRIFPAYLVSFWICALILSPFVGAYQYFLSFNVIIHNVFYNFCLAPPEVPGSFQGLHYPVLNGAMWTISYEFRCYISVVIIGFFGKMCGISIKKLRWFIFLIAISGLIINAGGLLHGRTGFYALIFGDPESSIRLFSVFGVGSVFYMFREKIIINNYIAFLSFMILGLLLLNKHTAEIGFAVLGGYIIFWFAFGLNVLQISIVDNQNDISYGLYLYAWPIQSYVIWNYREVNPWFLCCITLIGAGLAGYASWHLIEKRANRLARVRYIMPAHPDTSGDS